jgi:two-component system sensor histidine kinase KdpD
VRAAAGVAIITAITALFSVVLHVNATTVGFAYLIAVLAIATTWGLPESTVASVCAMLLYNFFFLPPVGRFIIADPQNWIALVTFLATALVASHLSERARKQTTEAQLRQRETEQLYALSRAILLNETGLTIGAHVSQHIATIFDCGAVALYDARSGDVSQGGAADLGNIESKLKQVVMQGATLHDAAAELLVAAVSLGGQPIGSLAIQGTTLSDGALQALLNLVAIALERVRTEEAANRAEVARQSEEFKSTLLDAIAHEFKTPLTSIKAASTAILGDSPTLSPQVRELTTIIDEETDRLSLLVTEAVRMSQIDAGKLRVERRPLQLRPLLENVLRSFESRLEGRTVNLELAAPDPHILADAELLSLALRQLIDNALKYSPPGTPLDISCQSESGRAILRLQDHGAGIPERDWERVFDKYYRRESARRLVPGTGLGLYIAREIARAHGQDLWIESAGQGGAQFCLGLPLEKS